MRVNDAAGRSEQYGADTRTVEANGADEPCYRWRAYLGGSSPFACADCLRDCLIHKAAPAAVAAAATASAPTIRPQTVPEFTGACAASSTIATAAAADRGAVPCRSCLIPTGPAASASTASR